LFCVFIFISNCAPNGESDVIKVDMTPNQVRVSQEERTAKFTKLVGRGVVEFRWSDDSGKHMEQGDLDFWKNGNAISFRISKLGELILWFGGENQHFWFFDLTGDETILTIGDKTKIFSDVQVALILLGLSPLPEGDLHIKDGVVSLWDEKGRLWEATFDRATNRPLVITLIEGEEKSTAIHRREVRVEIENKHELHWPITGGLIDLDEKQGNAEIKIVFSTLSTIVDEEPMEQVLDLDYLTKALKPEVIVEESK
jgi:hypothetical protein